MKTLFLLAISAAIATGVPASAASTYAPTDAQRQELLRVREDVWRAWFSNDQSRMQQLVTENLVASDAGEGEWKGRPQFLSEAADFAKNKGRIISLSFPKTEIQIFGDVAVLYSVYELHFESGGKEQQLAGRATEIFHREDGSWRNTGWTLDAKK